MARPSSPRAPIRCEVLVGVARAGEGEFGISARVFAFAGGVPCGDRTWTSGIVHAPDSVLAAEAAAALVGLSLLPKGCEAHVCLGDRRLADLFLSGASLDRFGVPDGLREAFSRLSKGRRIVLDLVGYRDTPGQDRLAEAAQTAAVRGAALRWSELMAMLAAEDGSGSAWFKPRSPASPPPPPPRRKGPDRLAPPKRP